MNYDPEPEQKRLIAFLDALIDAGSTSAYLTVDDFLHLTAINWDNDYRIGWKYDYEPRDTNGEPGVLGIYKKKLKIIAMQKEER